MLSALKTATAVLKTRASRRSRRSSRSRTPDAHTVADCSERFQLGQQTSPCASTPGRALAVAREVRVLSGSFLPICQQPARWRGAVCACELLPARAAHSDGNARRLLWWRRAGATTRGATRENTLSRPQCPRSTRENGTAPHLAHPVMRHQPAHMSRDTDVDDSRCAPPADTRTPQTAGRITPARLTGRTPYECSGMSLERDQTYACSSESTCSRTRLTYGRQRLRSQTVSACFKASRASPTRPARSSTKARSSLLQP